MLGNKDIGASMQGIQFNRHTKAHMYRAVQEGVIYALKYGFDVLESLQCTADVIRASDANMFLSPLFSQLFSTITGSTLEIYDTDGAKGAALAAGVGQGVYTTMQEVPLARLRVYEPESGSGYQELYQNWKDNLNIK
jgi:xylulokinase